MIDLDDKLRLHPQFKHEVVHVGRERTPVLVIDNFLDDAQVMVDYAAEHSSFAPADAYYPGVRAPIPPIYSFAVRAFLGETIRNAFALPSSDVAREKCDFSIVTTPPDRLSPLQRLPHIDNTNPKHFALLHFLCGPEDGGTSFYRHRATGFETVGPGDLAAYNKAIESEIASAPPPAGYIRGENSTFERTASVGAAFNRMIVYRGLVLHSADIPADFAFDPNPRSGRLTANVFYYFR